MSALDFPTAPSVGQLYPPTGIPGVLQYRWDGTVWKATAIEATPRLVVSDTAPVGADDNTLWWESDTGILYILYNDGTSTQWVQAVVTPTLDLSGAVQYTAQTKTAAEQKQARANISAALKGHLHGLVLANSGGDPSHGIVISAGEAASNDGSDPVLMVLPSALDKRVNLPWAVGTTVGGLDTGAVAATTWYHLFLIMRPDTGVVDVLFSLSASAPTLPANYTRFRRIGSIYRVSSVNKPFVQIDDYFQYVTMVTDLSAAAPGNINTVRALSMPSGLKLRAHLAWSTILANGYPDGRLQIGSADQSGRPSVGTYGASPTQAYGTIIVQTDTARQIVAGSIGNTADITMSLYTMGWWDQRGTTGYL